MKVCRDKGEEALKFLVQGPRPNHVHPEIRRRTAASAISRAVICPL